MTVASYIAAIAAFAVLVILLMSLALNHSYFGYSLQQQQSARNAAEAALQQAMVAVLTSQNQSWGTQQLKTDIVVFSSSDGSSSGIVTFNPVVAKDKKVPQSWNNLRGSGILPGSLGRQVPIHVVQLVARGTCGDSTKTLEMLFHVPPFPNALASEGPVKSRGGLFVGGVTDPSKFTGDYKSVSDEDKAPAHVISNSNSADAVNLGPGATIEGNVAAVGGVLLDPSVKVVGQVRQHIEPQPIPKLDMTALFAKVGNQTGSDALGPVVPSLKLAWNAHRDGNLVVQGDLQLDSGVLLVNGDLTVQGGVTGSGAIFVQGETKIQGGATFHSSDQVAVVSGKRILLNGKDKASYFFQGLMYSEEDIVANDVTVLGAVIARGLGGLELNDVNLLNSPVTISLVNGMEIQNYSDDDTVKMEVRVETRDPKTQKPTSYRALLAGLTDKPPKATVKYIHFNPFYGTEHLSEPQWQGGLKNYEDIRQFFVSHAAVAQGFAKNRYRLSWLWNATKPLGNTEPLKKDVEATFPDPLRAYLDYLDGKRSESRSYMGVDLNPNEVLGVLERSRLLLWREVPNN